MADLRNFFGQPEGLDVATIPKPDNIVPAGKYPVKIESSEMAQNKKQTGHYLKVVSVILDGPEGTKGRKLFDYINLDNPNETTRRIAMSQAASLWAALNIPRMVDDQEIVGGICIACVKVKDDNNNIRAYESLPPAAVGAPPVATQAPPVQAPPVTYGPPAGVPSQPVIQESVPPPTAPMTYAPIAPPVQPQPGAPPRVAGEQPGPEALATEPPRPWQGQPAPQTGNPF